MTNAHRPFDERDLPPPTSAAAVFDQPTGRGVVQEYDGKLYVILSNVRGTLAVYRVRNDGMLKRLRQPPHGLAPDWYEQG